MTRSLLAAVLAFCLALVAGAAHAGVLDTIKADGRITIAYPDNALPFAAKAASGEPEGYSIEICRRVVTGIQEQLGLSKLDIKWVAGNTPKRLDMVANGKAQMDCGTTTITLARQEQVDFSNEIFVESGGILVLSQSDINTLEDLAGKKIAAVPGTTTEKRLAKTLKSRLISANMTKIKDAAGGMELLDAGKVDAVASDRLVIVGQVTAAEDPSRYAMLTAQFSIDPYGLALPRSDADMRLAVNRALARVYRSGAIESIFRRWFGTNAKPTAVLEAMFLLNALPD